MLQRINQVLPLLFGHLAYGLSAVQKSGIQYRFYQGLRHKFAHDFRQPAFAEFLKITHDAGIQLILGQRRFQIQFQLQRRPAEMLQAGHLAAHGQADRPGDPAADKLQLAELLCYSFAVSQYGCPDILQGKPFQSFRKPFLRLQRRQRRQQRFHGQSQVFQHRHKIPVRTRTRIRRAAGTDNDRIGSQRMLRPQLYPALGAAAKILSFLASVVFHIPVTHAGDLPRLHHQADSLGAVHQTASGLLQGGQQYRNNVSGFSCCGKHAPAALCYSFQPLFMKKGQ